MSRYRFLFHFFMLFLAISFLGRNHILLVIQEMVELIEPLIEEKELHLEKEFRDSH